MKTKTRKSKKVLVVDDEKFFLMSLTDGLEEYGEEFTLLTASNGKEALRVLSSEAVDLIVTDLAMPEMNGFELLAKITNDCPEIPVIVMTAFGNPEIKKRVSELGTINYLEKPLELDELAHSILETLSRDSAGYIKGFTLAGFLQLLRMEQKSCLLKITRDNEFGYLALRDGELINSTVDKMSGLEAAYLILSWDNPKIIISSKPHRIKRIINEPLEGILMEAFRRKDESSRDRMLEQAEHKEEIETVQEVYEEEFDTELPDQNSSQLIITKEKSMAIENLLTELKSINGYKAAAIMNFTGEILVSDSIDNKIDLDLVGATFNDIFRSAHDASKKIGLDACKETTIVTPNGLIIMQCSGVESKVHIHAIAVLAAGGNQALMKIQLAKVLPLAMNDLG